MISLKASGIWLIKWGGILPLTSRVNVLASESYIQDIMHFRDVFTVVAPYMNVMIDSGAYTNLTVKRQTAVGKKPFKKPVTLENYIKFCQSHYHGVVWRYIALDVIKDSQGSEDNLKAMLDAGLNPMPVFIEGWDQSKIANLLKIDHRLCVAGGVTGNDHYIRKRFREVFKVSGDIAQIHALGYFRYPDIYQLPIASSDSSSWCAGIQYGHMKIFSPREGFSQVNWQQLFKGGIHSKKRARFLRHLVVNCQIKKAFLKDSSNYTNRFGIPALVTTYAYLRAMEFGKGKGFEYILAVVDPESLCVILAVLHTLTPQGFDYHPARDLVIHLRKLRKDKPGQWLKLCEAIAKEYQGWQNEAALT
jgi:hypothetical protein